MSNGPFLLLLTDSKEKLFSDNNNENKTPTKALRFCVCVESETSHVPRLVLVRSAEHEHGVRALPVHLSSGKLGN